jgi:3-oxoacyl-[acyl-carrier protein] reductase
MGRIGRPDDIARSVLYFASELSTYVTGQVLGVDGGMLI